MILDDIRRLKEAVPFQAFKIVLTNGDELRIDRRAAIGIGPDGRFLMYALEPAGCRFVNPAEVTTAELLKDTAARARA